MFRAIWAWLATRSASFFILAASSLVITAGVAYIQQLRIDAARCKGQQDVQAQLDRLTKRVTDDIEKSADESIRQIRQTPDGCARERVPDSILDSLRDD